MRGVSERSSWDLQIDGSHLLESAGGQVALTYNFVLTWKHQQVCASCFPDNTTPLGLTSVGMSIGCPETRSWSTDKLSQLCTLSAAKGASAFLGCYSVLELFQNKTEPLAPPLLCFKSRTDKSLQPVPGQYSMILTQWVSLMRNLLGKSLPLRIQGSASALHKLSAM